MNDKEILEKAIQKAIDGGWDLSLISNGWGVDDFRKPVVGKDGDIWQYDGDDKWITLHKEVIIFNHDFAKALWSNPIIITEDQYEELQDGKLVKTENTKEYGLPFPMFKYHLMQMVISDDPIKYLGDNI